MESRWSARRVARQVGRSNLTVTFKYESSFNLSSDDNHVRVWWHSGERLNLAFTLQSETTFTAGVMIWGVIAYDTWPPLILIHNTMILQWYLYDLLQLHVLPLMVGVPGFIFQQDKALPHSMDVKRLLLTHNTLSWPAQSPDLSPIEHIWDNLGQLVGSLGRGLVLLNKRCVYSNWKTRDFSGHHTELI
ncbi:transposable element Tcb2 transposase [Trichonephila clavipes]|nr:transposable element Tcb2 transposase [Trichonephila clavipes]